FLRTELPTIAADAGITDDFVLYTDVDVMFMAEVADFFETQRPEYFAVAPELDPNDLERINAGVMWMNLRRLRELDARFRQFISDNLDLFALDAWDQSAYRHFFRTPNGEPVWDPLPVEYNFKPYWGHHPAPKIVHFHGPKPQHRAILASENIPADLKGLHDLARFSYSEMCDRWGKLLKEANA